MHVGRQPHDVLDIVGLDEAQELGQLELAAEGAAVIPVGPRLIGALRHVGVVMFLHTVPSSSVTSGLITMSA
jgi:hypothetical protein